MNLSLKMQSKHCLEHGLFIILAISSLKYHIHCTHILLFRIEGILTKIISNLGVSL